MELVMQRLTMDKATQYTRKSVEKARTRAEELDIKVANVDNEIAQALLQVADVASRLKRTEQTVDEQNGAIQQQNDKIEGVKSCTRNNALVERKQMQIDQLSKKIGRRS